MMVQMEKAMATHSSTLAWKIPWTEEPGKLQSIGLHRVGPWGHEESDTSKATWQQQQMVQEFQFSVDPSSVIHF